jgi:hypothetical protein
MHNLLPFLIFGVISIIWITVGVYLGKDLPEPKNIRQHIILIFILGPLGVVLWIFVYGGMILKNRITKLYNRK